METFYKLFGSLLSFVYHCFDRMVILAYLPLLTREENIVHFFRDVNGIWPLTQEALRERPNRYRGWVDSYAADHGIPIEWAEKGVRKEDHVAPSLQRMRRKNQFGVYSILRSMEVGPTFRSFQPRYPVEDPDYRILRRRRSRYTHFYFYIHDPVLGALSLCIGSFLPFQINCYLNGHSFIERELMRRGIGYRKNDNAFLGVDDPEALQQIADSFNAALIQRRLDYWIDQLGPPLFTPRTPSHLVEASILPPTDRVLPQPDLPSQLSHPQALRALLRSRPLSPQRRQDLSDLWLPAPSPSQGQARQRARQHRPRAPRAACRLQECTAPHVREIQHVPSTGGLKQ